MNDSSFTQDWVPIRTTGDIWPFVNRVVTFRTNIRYFGDGQNTEAHAWSLRPSNPPKERGFYGYINFSKGPNPKLYLTAIVRPDFMGSVRHLAESVFRLYGNDQAVEGNSKGFLDMRLAADHEILRVREAVVSGEARVEFDHTAFRKALVLG